MKKKKNKNWLVIGFIALLVLILVLLIYSSSGRKENTKLNLNEKRWIEENKKEVINVSVANNIPVFSNEGEGVFFDFIKKTEERTELSFNLISYDASKDVQKNSLYFEVIKKDKVDSLKKDAMVFYKDYYALISKSSDRVYDLNDITDKKIGIISSDLSDVSFYLPSAGNSFSTYDSDGDLQNALSNDNVDYIIAPKTRYYSFILGNNYHIVYNLTELKEAYILNVSKSEDDELKSIINKKYNEYKLNNLEKSYDKYLSSFVLEQNNISEKLKADFSKKTYTYGYIVNNPYSDMVNKRLIGLDSTYLKMFSDLTDATFTYKKYRSVKDLNKAINKNDVDIATSYYNYPELTGKYNKTMTPYGNEFVILVKKNNNDLVINSLKSLKDKNVITLKTGMASYLSDTIKAKVDSYDRISTLLGKVKKDSILVLDQNTYNLYKSSDLSNFRVVSTVNQNIEHGFIINVTNENETFNKLFSSYLEMSNYKQIYNQAWKDYYDDSKEISHTLVYIIIIAIVGFVIWLFTKKKIKIKKRNKEDRIVRYIDPLTSLKNRHYLNKNFEKWEKNAIYPQAVIVINLNNLRHVNDVYGHEEGDKLLKQAANILIKNQLEQSDIIRTDGNEYLIYMVGYEKNKVVTYMRKLYKELGELPYGFGATLGYSMIEDDIKSIDDAINEAVLEIRASKEMNNKK